MTGKYSKQCTIGSGTFGEAWLVQSKCSGRLYVMKEIKMNQMTYEDIERTKREVSVLARCKHVNIIRYKENFFVKDPSAMCLVMEYADGGDLHDQVQWHIDNGRLMSQSAILHWFIQVLFAVQYLHSNNILHRDLKTQNIFLTKENIVKVGDFGISRTLRGHQDLATTVIGTPYYLSPEICLSKPYNHKSDMWALGCILYELSSLKHPFEADNFENLVVIILKGFYAPISLSYAPILHHLISVLLRSNPINRPSAEQLLLAPALKPLVSSYMKTHEKLILAAENLPSSPAQTFSPRSLGGKVTKNSDSQTPEKSSKSVSASMICKMRNGFQNSPVFQSTTSEQFADSLNGSNYDSVDSNLEETLSDYFQETYQDPVFRTCEADHFESTNSSSSTLSNSQSHSSNEFPISGSSKSLTSPGPIIGNKTYIVSKS